MNEPTDFSARRWMNGGSSKDFKPVEALKAAIRDIEEGRVDPTHALVILPVQDSTHVYSAGTLDYLARIGLASRAKTIIEDDL